MWMDHVRTTGAGPSGGGGRLITSARELVLGRGPVPVCWNQEKQSSSRA